MGVRGIEPSFSIVGAHAILFDTNFFFLERKKQAARQMRALQKEPEIQQTGGPNEEYAELKNALLLSNTTERLELNACCARASTERER